MNVRARPGWLIIVTLCISLAGCLSRRASHDTAPTIEATLPMASQVLGQTTVFDCGTAEDVFRMVLRHGHSDIAVWLPPRFNLPYLVLDQTRAASGARFANDVVTLWTHGNQALLIVGHERFENCRLNRRASIWEQAKLDGVDFRATGNEPGWVLEIRDGHSLSLRYDYGQRLVETPCPVPTSDGDTRRTVYHAVTETHDLTVTLVGEPCSDTMSDEQFSTRVSIELGGARPDGAGPEIRRFAGCGRPLH